MQLIDTNTIVKSSLSVSSTDNNSELSGSFNAKPNNNDESTIRRFTDVSVNDHYDFVSPTSTNAVPSKFIKKESHDE